MNVVTEQWVGTQDIVRCLTGMSRYYDQWEPPHYNSVVPYSLKVQILNAILILTVSLLDTLSHMR